MRLSKDAEEAIHFLRREGYRFNIVNKVENRTELHYAYTRLDGTERVHFVAEVDSYGNITDWGPYTGDAIKMKPYVINADGEKIYVEDRKKMAGKARSQN